MLPEIELPEKLLFLLEPRRYKVAWGGRGGGKSWSFARALLGLSVIERKRILCARQVQKSIRESVHELLANTIRDLNMGAYWEVLDGEIRGIVSGSTIDYTGLQSHTAQSIKSFEGVDYCWVEEAQTVPASSFDILTPTIRKAGSEVWLSMNPILLSDPAWQMFCMRPDPDVACVHVTYRDNPWFTEELEKERRRALENMEPERYENIWEGTPKGQVEGAIYGRQIAWMRKAGRIGRVPPVQRLRVNAFLDLGTSVGNATAVWMHQHHGTQHLFLQYWADTGRGMRHWWQVMNTWRAQQGLRWGAIYLPHDGRANLQAAEVTNRQEILERLAADDQQSVEIQAVPRVTDLSAALELTAERMADALIDEAGCADGISALENYQYEWDSERQAFKRQPAHNWASNGADAFRQWATGYDFNDKSGAPRPRTEAGQGAYANGY